LSKWQATSLIKTFTRGSGARDEILLILEDLPEGLSVMDILRYLRERGYVISRQAVSNNVEALTEKALIWKKLKFNHNTNRDLWYYISARSFNRNASDSLREEMIQFLSNFLEKNSDMAPEFNNISFFVRFLENLIQTATEEITSSEELWMELSKRKPYDRLSLLAVDYNSVVSNISEIIRIHPELKLYALRRGLLNLSPKVAAGTPYNMAMTIVDGAIRGEKRYLEALGFLSNDIDEEIQDKIKGFIELPKKRRDEHSN